MAAADRLEAEVEALTPVSPGLEPYVDDDLTLWRGDAVEVLRELPERSIHAVLTSPPFYKLRDYKVDGQIGLEDSPEEWASRLVEVFAECRRVLRDDGTLWVECGDSYAANVRSGLGIQDSESFAPNSWSGKQATGVGTTGKHPYKQKDLVGAPFLLAFALRADGWYWRGSYVWEKPDAMPESATDRCTTAHSYVFQFSKQARYFFDQDAIREPFSDNTHSAGRNSTPLSDDPAKAIRSRNNRDFQAAVPLRHVDRPDPGQLNLEGEDAEPEQRGPDGRRVTTVTATHNSEQHRDGERWPSPSGRNARSVWRIATEATSFGLCPVCRTYWEEKAPAQHCGVDVVAHFATWPHALAGKIIACSTSEAGVCGDCGAPRTRVSEKSVENPGNRSNNGQRGRSAERRGFDVRREVASSTVGWEPSCDCDAETVPATVLDPFAGSATTGRQARAMGRRSVLIELSPEYAEIAARRLGQQSIWGEAM